MLITWHLGEKEQVVSDSGFPTIWFRCASWYLRDAAFEFVSRLKYQIILYVLGIIVTVLF